MGSANPRVNEPLQQLVLLQVAATAETHHSTMSLREGWSCRIGIEDRLGQRIIGTGEARLVVRLLGAEGVMFSGTSWAGRGTVGDFEELMSHVIV